MTREEFIKMVGVRVLILPACTGFLAGCNNLNVNPSSPTNVDFTLDVSTGSLAQNGGYVVKNGVIVARTQSGSFLAVSSGCTHEGTTVQYKASQNEFYCPNHGALFASTGKVLQGPASRSLAQYNTTLTGNSLRVFS
jgi:cytochrome b6-f complex iron-sulfur subunit